jgi:hypothetical protein
VPQKLQKSKNFQNSIQYELCSSALKSPYKIIQVHVQFLEHNIQVSVPRYKHFYQIIVLIDGSKIYSDFCLKIFVKIYLVMAQTFDLYAILYET